MCIAVAFIDDDLEVENDKLKEIPKDFVKEIPERYQVYEITLKTIN